MLEVTMLSSTSTTGRSFFLRQCPGFDRSHQTFTACWHSPHVPHNLSMAATPFKVSPKNNVSAKNNFSGLDAPEAFTNVMEVDDSDDFVDVGHLCSPHGVKGEVKVMSVTDFPEQRFERSGMRWVGFYRMGRLMGLRKMNLLCGRKIMQGKDPAWLLTFEGVDSREKASELVGATMVVKNSDRPILDDDQFYIPELVGMSVRMKDSGNEIGSIVDVFDSGANHLLQVEPINLNKQNQKEAKMGLFWIPFVKEIVPIVDTEKRFVGITPPQGLLELNDQSQRPLKKELKRQVLRSKRKLQDRMSGVRKKVLALKQEHILSGLVHGDESQRESLKVQLLAIDFSLFKRAMETSSVNSSLSLNNETSFFTSTIPSPLDWKGLNRWLCDSPKDLAWGNKIDKSTWRLWHRGLMMVADRKAAIAGLLTEVSKDMDMTDCLLKSNLENQASQIFALQKLAKIISGEMPLIPWVLVTVEALSDYIKNYLKDESYFGLSEQQVHFVKLSCLPCVTCDAKGARTILMESQWKMVVGAGGDGQVVPDLDDSGVLKTLMEMGVTYVHLCSLAKPPTIIADPAIFGFMEEQNSCVGLKVSSGAFEDEHGILCIQKGSVDGRGRSIFTSDTEQTAGSMKSTTESFEHFVVSKAPYVLKEGVLVLEEDKHIYRVPINCNYTLSAEYARHLSQQRHCFVYESEVKGTCSKEPNELIQDDFMQLTCSLHNVLQFCSPSKVALFNCEQKFEG